MGIGKIILDDAGAVTAPTDALNLSLGSAQSTTQDSDMPVVFSDVPPDHPSAIFTDGISPVRHLLEGAVYRTGGLAPKAAPTADPTGDQAAVTLTLDSAYNPANNEYLYAWADIKFVTALSASPTFSVEVLIAASGALTLDNLKGAVDGSKTEGVAYQFKTPAIRSSFRGKLTVAHPSQYVLTFTAIDYGTVGNGYLAYFASGVWTSCTLGTSNDSNVGTAGYFSGGTDGSGTDPAAGTYKYIYQGKRSADGALTGGSPASAAATQGTAQNIDLTGLTANADTTFDYTRWSRTLKDQGLYHKGEEIARAGTTDTDDLSDTDLVTPAPIIYQQKNFRTYRAGHIPRHLWATAHQGRVFYGGARKMATYSAGTAAVTAASDTVTITGGYPLSTHEGRTFAVASTPEEYLIVAVSESAGTYTLDRNYEGTTNGTASYTVTDTREETTPIFSMPGRHNQAPSTNVVGGMVSKAGRGTLAAISIWESLIVFTRDKVYRMSGATSSNYALRPVSGAMGTVSPRSFVDVDGTLYWLATDGIYEWRRDSRPQNITRPIVQEGVVRGINETIKSINSAHYNWVHAHHAEDEKVIRFFVPLDSDVVPHHAIVYDLQTGAWAIDRVPGVTAAATVTKPDGDRITVFGTVTGDLFQADIGNSDGCYGVEPKTTATSGTTRTWTDTAASFGDVAGCPFFYTDLVGSFGLRTIESNTSTVLTFTEHLDSAVAAGWQGYVGGIWAHMRSGRSHYGIPDEPKSISNLHLAYSPDSDGKAIVAVAADQDALAKPTYGSEQADLSDASGDAHILMNTSGRAHQFEVHAPEPGCDPHLLSIALDLHARTKAQVGA